MIKTCPPNSKLLCQGLGVHVSAFRGNGHLPWRRMLCARPSGLERAYKGHKPKALNPINLDLLGGSGRSKKEFKKKPINPKT